MDQCADHGAEKSGNGEGDGKEIEAHGECKVHFDGRHHPSGERQQAGKLADLVIDEDDICGIYRNVAADPAHGDAHVGHFKRRCVVDAVADHADRIAFPLISGNPVQFILRQTTGMYIPDPELARDRIGGMKIVPGQENGPDADPAEGRDHVFAFFPYRVGQNEISCRDLIDNDVNHSTSFIQISAGAGGKFLRSSFLSEASDSLLLQLFRQPRR